MNIISLLLFQGINWPGSWESGGGKWPRAPHYNKKMPKESGEWNTLMSVGKEL